MKIEQFHMKTRIFPFYLHHLTCPKLHSLFLEHSFYVSLSQSAIKKTHKKMDVDVASFCSVSDIMHVFYYLYVCMQHCFFVCDTITTDYSVIHQLKTIVLKQSNTWCTVSSRIAVFIYLEYVMTQSLSPQQCASPLSRL